MTLSRLFRYWLLVATVITIARVRLVQSQSQSQQQQRRQQQQQQQQQQQLPVECNWDIQCEELYKPGSKCMNNGRCSNPFASGCLYNFYTQYSKWDSDTNILERRTCNSDDHNDNNDTSSSSLSFNSCDDYDLNYPEIRIHHGDWESTIFYSWIIQIFLSEFLHVPTTVGLSPDDTPLASFYNPNADMHYSNQSYAFEDVVTANENNGRCDITDEKCIHVMPEVWIGQEKKWKDYLGEGHIDQVNGDGQVGKISWYIPVYTAKRHPHVASFHGMAGRRQEMAEIFHRPTSWEEYCTEVSTTNCRQDDGIASRPPEAGEEDKYFQDGEYIGHFRATEQNNCSANPTNCTGHIVGAPCSWSTNVDAQTYHNDISLESNGPLIENGGYSSGQMIQIWRAANATQSHVVMWWFTPDATIEEFRGTDFQFQQVLLPEPTSECRQARIEPNDRCNTDPIVRRGQQDGGCDNEANSLQKVVASSLRDLTYETPQVERSPGYQAILNLKVNHLDINTMLQQWVAGGRSGYAAREAVCDWVVDHQDELESYIPRGYPRVFAEDTNYTGPLFYAAWAVAGFAIIYVLVNVMLVFLFQNTKVFVYAQVPFIFMVLVGLLLVACGSILYALEPEDGICVSQVWLVTLGYTLELVPLLVKVAAINRLMAATKRMRRVKISMRSLFCTVASLVMLVIIFLTIWTALDTPQRTEGRYLLEEDNFEIHDTLTCASDSFIWDLVVICWNGLLIVCATVLAFQSRTIKQEFNDSRTLGTMIYSHFVFAVLRAVTFNLGTSTTGRDDDVSTTNNPSIAPSTLAAASSFLISMDVITAVTIYIVPKISAARKAPQDKNYSSSDPSDPSSSKYVSKGHHSHHPVRSQNVSLNGTNRSNSSRKLTGGTMEGSTRSRSGSSGKPRGWTRSVNSMPSIDEIDEEDASEDNMMVPASAEESSPSSPPNGSNNLDKIGSNHSSTHRRVGMDGSLYDNDVVVDDDDEDTSSSDEMDYGGPRFARTPSVEASSSNASNVSKGSNSSKSEATNNRNRFSFRKSSSLSSSAPPSMDRSIGPIEEGSETFSKPFELQESAPTLEATSPTFREVEEVNPSTDRTLESP